MLGNNLDQDNSNKGFTLLELIIVIAIMAVLVGFIVPIYVRYAEKSKVTTDMQVAKAVHDAIEAAVADEYISDRPVGGVPLMNVASLDTLPNTDFVDEIKDFLQVNNLADVDGKLKSKAFKGNNIKVKIENNITTVTLSSNKAPDIDHLVIE